MIDRYFCGILFVLLAGGWAWSIEVSTSVAAVSHEGNAQKVGSFTLTLTANDLAAASQSTPIYIRFGLAKANGWSHSLVDLRNDFDEPINLALYPLGETVLNPDLPADAVQLVRMVAGESFAWLKVSSPTSIWVWDGAPSAPSSAHRVSLSIGIRGSLSDHPGSSTPSTGNEHANSHLLADTTMRVNYRNTPDFGNGDLDSLSLIAFDSETSGVETGVPQQGNNTGIGFSNDFVVARGANYFPCFEYHFQVDNFDAPPYEVEVGLVDLYQRRGYRTDVPPVFLTNSSDFEWEPGSRFFLVNPDYQPAYDVLGTPPDICYDPSIPATHLLPGDVQLRTSSELIWSVEEVYFLDRFMGYQFELITGKMPLYGYLEVSGLRLGTAFERDALSAEPLRVSAWGYYKAQGVTPSQQLGEIGPINALTAHVGLGENSFQQVLPYTAYDRPDFEFSAHVSNPYSVPVRCSLIIYHAAGVLEKVLGELVLPAHGKLHVPFNQWPDRKRNNGWMAIYSEKPIAAAGVIENTVGSSLDIYGHVDQLASTLYGAHIPDDFSWETIAYMVSADPNVDPSFTYRLPGDVDTRRIPGFRIPSGTGHLSADDFLISGPASWFEVQAQVPTAAGLLLYRSLAGPSQLATVPMAGEAQDLWTYEHVANEQNGWWNGVVITNPSPETNRVTVAGFSQDGDPLASIEIQVATDTRFVQQLAKLLDTDTPIARLVLTGTSPFVSFLLLGRVEGDRLTTTPGNLEAHRSMTMPYLPDLARNWVGLALVNDQLEPIQVLLAPYRDSGEDGQTVLVTVPPQQKILLSLADVFAGNTAYSHMNLSSDIPFYAYSLTGDNNNSELATLPLSAL